MILVKANEGTVDRVVRVIVGIVLVVLGVYMQSLWRILPVIVGIALIVTGIMGYCHAYTLMGINTKGK